MNHIKKEYNVVFIDAEFGWKLYEQLNKWGQDGWTFVGWYDEPNSDLKNGIKQAILVRDILELKL